MIDFFEEKIGRCQNETLSTHCTQCVFKGAVRRTVNVEFMVFGKFQCEKCMPDFFRDKSRYVFSYKNKAESIKRVEEFAKINDKNNRRK